MTNLITPLNGHRLDKRLRRFNWLKSELNELLLKSKLDRLDPDEKILWDYISYAIEFADEIASEEDLKLQLFI